MNKYKPLSIQRIEPFFFNPESGVQQAILRCETCDEQGEQPESVLIMPFGIDELQAFVNHLVSHDIGSESEAAA